MSGNFRRARGWTGSVDFLTLNCKHKSLQLVHKRSSCLSPPTEGRRDDLSFQGRQRKEFLSALRNMTWVSKISSPSAAESPPSWIMLGPAEMSALSIQPLGIRGPGAPLLCPLAFPRPVVATLPHCSHLHTCLCFVFSLPSSLIPSPPPFQK